MLGFNDQDLAANRDGRLGQGQVPRLMWSGAWRLIVGPAVLIFSLALAVSAVDYALAAVVILVFAGLSLFLTWLGFAFLVDAIDGRVAFVTGLLQPNMVSGKTTSYYADCGPVHKLISHSAYEALPRGLTCHLYYAPGSRSLLSIEPASEGEPKPDHPFGPDSAHVWDRVRVSWVAITIGVLAVLFSVHSATVAHPARPVPVGGTVSDYREYHGKSTHRELYLGSDPGAYTPYAEDSYSPPAPSFGTLIGKELVLYVNDGTRDVLAINDGDGLYASDWYLNPEHQRESEVDQAVIAGLISLFVMAAGVVGLFYRRLFPGRVFASEQAPSDPLFARTPLYSLPSIAPPRVRPWHSNWGPAAVLVGVGCVVFVILAIATH